MRRHTLLTIIVLFVCLFAAVSATPLVYRPYKLPEQDYPVYNKRANAELVNGLLGMDFKRLNTVGKRNAELVNGLIGMDLNRLSNIGRR